MGLTSGLVDLAVAIIDRLGYVGVFVLMTLESMVAPVPSEGVMPFAGFLAADGRMNLWLAIAVATLGSVAGSWISYELGKHLGRPAVVRWGRWFLVTERDLDLTDRFFRRWGNAAVFLARFVPVVRHLVSLPAGVARMSLVPFLIATAAGAFLWNWFLAWVGFKLGQHWEAVRQRLEPFDYAILVLGTVVVAWYVILHVRRLRSERRARPASDEAP